MAVVHIGGQPAALPEAMAEAARCLGRARFPVIAGLGADAAGVRAAIQLARRLGGAFDHMASDAVLASLGAMRDAGWMIVSPAELRRRADVIVFAGRFAEEAWPALLAIMPEAKSAVRMISLGAGPLAKRAAAAGYALEAIDSPAGELPGLIATLRARAGGRSTAAGVPLRQIDAIVSKLAEARFGVAIWSASSLDRLTTQMLCGLVKDLNARTRFSGLPWPAGDNGAGAAQVAGWLTGFPMRTGFGRGAPEHDPWRFDARRLVESGEADAALWLSAYRPQGPDWSNSVPLIALTAKGTNFATPPHVHVELGLPGIDHDAVEYRTETGGLAHVAASRPSDAPPAADILAGILAALPEEAQP